MVSILAFSLLATFLVWCAGRPDPARDPRLTTAALAVLAALPLLLALPLPGLLPADHGNGAAPPAARLGPWLLGLWMTGSAAMLARLALAALSLRRARRGSDLLERRGRVELRLADAFRGPVAAGVWRPVVFLPREWHRWNTTTRRVVLLHELAHHSRHDPLRRWVAAFACALHWWNPLVWWMARRLHEQCEFACDARVVAAGVQADRYAHLLCDLCAAPPAPHPALGMAETSTLEHRVRRLALGSRPGGSRALVVALVAATLVTGLGLALLKPAKPRHAMPSPREVQLRLSADPFPAE